jgi:peptide-methionine (S)-S-oxide reductase
MKLPRRRARPRIAEKTIVDVNASGLWPGKVVTKVVPASDFWEAESPNMKNILNGRYPGYTCHYVRPDWKLRTQRSSSLK